MNLTLLISLIVLLAVAVVALAGLWLFGPWKPGSRHAGVKAPPAGFRPMETQRFNLTATQPGRWRG